MLDTVSVLGSRSLFYIKINKIRVSQPGSIGRSRIDPTGNLRITNLPSDGSSRCFLNHASVHAEEHWVINSSTSQWQIRNKPQENRKF